MSKQSQALRLADEVQRPYIKASAWEKEAAAELRRLHEANTELLAALKYLTEYSQQHGVMPAALTKPAPP